MKSQCCCPEMGSELLVSGWLAVLRGEGSLLEVRRGISFLGRGNSSVLVSEFLGFVLMEISLLLGIVIPFALARVGLATFRGR